MECYDGRMQHEFDEPRLQSDEVVVFPVFREDSRGIVSMQDTPFETLVTYK